jgi:hypothetical protein
MRNDPWSASRPLSFLWCCQLYSVTYYTCFVAAAHVAVCSGGISWLLARCLSHSVSGGGWGVVPQGFLKCVSLALED